MVKSAVVPSATGKLCLPGSQLLFAAMRNQSSPLKVKQRHESTKKMQNGHLANHSEDRQHGVGPQPLPSLWNNLCPPSGVKHTPGFCVGWGDLAECDPSQPQPASPAPLLHKYLQRRSTTPVLQKMGRPWEKNREDQGHL